VMCTSHPVFRRLLAFATVSVGLVSCVSIQLPSLDAWIVNNSIIAQLAASRKKREGFTTEKSPQPIRNCHRCLPPRVCALADRTRCTASTELIASGVVRRGGTNAPLLLAGLFLAAMQHGNFQQISDLMCFEGSVAYALFKMD
jgi:hypothetical protein